MAISLAVNRESTTSWHRAVESGYAYPSLGKGSRYPWLSYLLPRPPLGLAEETDGIGSDKTLLPLIHRHRNDGKYHLTTRHTQDCMRQTGCDGRVKSK